MAPGISIAEAPLRVPTSKSRPWHDVLDNLGENLIRLGTSLTALAEGPTVPANDAAFAPAIERIASGFRLAFRQARPLLTSGEKVFLQLARASVEELASSHSAGVTEPIARAHTLVHEGVLVCQEMVAVLNTVEQAAQTDPDATRQTFTPALGHLAETTAAAGWELRTVCHEYVAEVRLAETTGMTIRELVPASMGLLHDMAAVADGLRTARREWFRIGQRLQAALRADSQKSLPSAGRELA